ENARLIAKITGLKVENTDIKAKYNNTINEILKLRAKPKSKIKKLEKSRTNTVAKNAKHNNAIVEFKAK
ncbi:1051_t:CDS:1, partial [Dentiscutata heterogama]